VRLSEFQGGMELCHFSSRVLQWIERCGHCPWLKAFVITKNGGSVLAFHNLEVRQTSQHV
jgi:hypothetical protein